MTDGDEPSRDQAEDVDECSMVSSLAVRRRPRRLGSFRYRDVAHAELPHVVSFSGGRSSAALTFMAAEEGLLDPDRGDIVLFANTSAEHPGTYEFAAECKRRIETDLWAAVLLAGIHDRRGCVAWGVLAQAQLPAGKAGPDRGRSRGFPAAAGNSSRTW